MNAVIKLTTSECAKKQLLLKKLGSPREHTYKYFLKEYLLEDDRWNGWIAISEASEYCSSRRKEVKGKPFGDPPREFETFRKDKTPCHWEEKRDGQNKYVKFCIPNEDNILEKDHGFSCDIKDAKLQESGYKCEITGLSATDGKLACDHWFPKEKGGESEKKNCVILNKIINEKKNNHLPVDWFCRHLLKNFLNVCKKMGPIDDIKTKLIKFIEGFE